MMKKMNQKIQKDTNGITLIALVITIIVLLILASVSIAMLTGENGILNKAQESRNTHTVEQEKEIIKLALIDLQAEKILKGKEITITDLSVALSSYEVKVVECDSEGNEETTGNIVKIASIKIADANNSINEEYAKIIFKKTGNFYVINLKTGKIVFNNNEGKQEEEEESDKEIIPDEPIYESKINEPDIMEGMIPVYWDDNNNEVYRYEDQFNEENWYNYDSKKWANAITEDGSYWVWIPRYEYKINYNDASDYSKGGTIDINFISKETVIPSNGYKIHPCFTNGVNNNYSNGEWDKEVSGIWVSKYEISMEEQSGFPRSLPGKTQWQTNAISDSYNYAKNFDTNKESHLMKNSEWGAVAYLTHSKYGRNGNPPQEISDLSINQYTGGGADDAYKENTHLSNTENITGIYDLNNGKGEVTAAYINNDRLSNGDAFATGQSTKHATVYPIGSEDGINENYNAYKSQIATRYGDAISETSEVMLEGSSTSGIERKRSWNSGFNVFPSKQNAFFIRGGGTWNGAFVSGDFSFQGSEAVLPCAPFRIVLIGE